MKRPSTRKLKKAQITTRGTPRQRAQKGFMQFLRRQILQDLSPERLEALFQSKLRRMSPDKQAQVEAELSLLPSESRRDYILKLLNP